MTWNEEHDTVIELALATTKYKPSAEDNIILSSIEGVK